MKLPSALCGVETVTKSQPENAVKGGGQGANTPNIFYRSEVHVEERRSPKPNAARSNRVTPAIGGVDQLARLLLS